MVQKKSKIKENKSFDFVLFITVLVLLAFGIIMVLSASSPYSLSVYGTSYHYVIRQLIAAVIGITGMIIISKINYKIYARFYKIIYFISVVGLLLVLVPKVGRPPINGARRWINVPIFGSFQPSELTKLGMIVFFAAFLTNKKEELRHIWKGFFKPICFVLPVVAILMFVQSHFSASVVIVLVVSVMMLMAGSRMSHFLSFGTAGATLGIGAMYILAKYFKIGGFRLTRVTAFLNPWADMQESGWQIIQSLYAIGSGGLFGVGLGNSKQKYLYISEPQNDFIFAVIAEELGFVGCVLVIVLFAIFVWRGILISMKAPDMFGSLLACGITALIGLQAIINIAVVTSSMPVTGIALPFFSYGGTSLIILLFAVGVLLNISRQTEKI